MPEIAEVARVVHYLRKSLVGKTLSVVKAQDDANVFGKVGTSAAEVEKALVGKKVLDVGRQGKYFWLIMSSPPHPVFHFGMTGWFYIKGEPTIHYRPKTEDSSAWPPKFSKLELETDAEPKIQAAFADSRRFGRIRLVDCAAQDIRNTTPLKENGPDPTIDKDIFTEEWLEKKMLSKRVPVKALLLDQANISGLGNWVGDEVMYHAKLHPEQYSHTFTSAQLKQLHKSILYVCQTAVDVLADSSKFPEEWLFNHRWGKGKKDAPTTLPNGEKIAFLTVGGRTSCICPNIQKKTGAVAGDVKKEAVEADSDSEKSDVNPARKAKGAEKSGQRKIASTRAGRESSHAEDPDSKDSVPRNATNETPPRKRKAPHQEGEKTKPEKIVPESKAKTKKRKASDQDEENASKEDSVRVPRGKTKKRKSTDEKQMTSTSDAQIALENRRRSGRVSKVKT